MDDRRQRRACTFQADAGPCGVTVTPIPPSWRALIKRIIRETIKLNKKLSRPRSEPMLTAVRLAFPGFAKLVGSSLWLARILALTIQGGM